MNFLCIGHPRCGTKSIARILNLFGYDVGHEGIKNDGIVSWMHAIKNVEYPWLNYCNNYILNYYIEVIKKLQEHK